LGRVNSVSKNDEIENTDVDCELTIPVTSASAERSFSKLKLIKIYLRNTMTQNRLSGLAMLSIENEIASELNFDSIIDALVV